MTNLSRVAIGLALAAVAMAGGDISGTVHGVVTKVDQGTKTITVKTADGTEHTMKLAGKTTVQGTKEGIGGIKEGSDVAVHYTTKGADKTAVEVDKLGKDGIKSTEGTITKIDRGTKTMVIKGSDGTEQTFKMTDHAADYSGKEIAAGSEKSAKVTVYYTEDAGKKVAHFFEKM